MLPWHTTSIFEDPDTFGLKLLTHVKLDTDGLEGICTGTWTMVALWKAKDGRLLIGNDAGCDCLSPFENKDVHDLTEVLDKDQIYAFVSDVWQTQSVQMVHWATDELAMDLA